MERDNEYSTGSVHLAALCLYVLGNASHVATYRIGDGNKAKFLFSFYDPTDKCSELKEAFFSQEGAAVENARGLLVCSQAIKSSIRAADRNPDGLWMRADVEGTV